jgi:hypothetical protein
VDDEGKFCWETKEFGKVVPVFAFGIKHKGKEVLYVALTDVDYFRWMTTADFSPAVTFFADGVYERYRAHHNRGADADADDAEQDENELIQHVKYYFGEPPSCFS